VFCFAVFSRLAGSVFILSRLEASGQLCTDEMAVIDDASRTVLLLRISFEGSAFERLKQMMRFMKPLLL
jgi:hypothetical protein